MTLYEIDLPSGRRRARVDRPRRAPVAGGPAEVDRRRIGRRLVLSALALALIAVAVWEGRTFRGQAWLLSKVAARLDTTLGAGAAPAIELSRPGPYDERLGYSRQPHELERLHQDGWRVVAQARLAPLHERLVRLGMAPVYREKTQTGLTILDVEGRPFYEVRYPNRVYGDFASVPPLVAQTLTFIENRELLDRSTSPQPRGRVGPARDRGARARRRAASAPGRSAAGRQHARDADREVPPLARRAYTAGRAEKLRQIGAATLRAYRAGPTPSRCAHAASSSTT